MGKIHDRRDVYVMFMLCYSNKKTTEFSLDRDSPVSFSLSLSFARETNSNSN